MIAGEPNGFSGPRIRWQSLAWEAAAGFLFGFIVLHPTASGVICRWLDPRIPAAVPDDKAEGFLALIAESFQPDMLAMGLAFGVIGALITMSHGHHRRILTLQRDRLAEQAQILKQKNAELARLELANRRTTQFMAHDFKTALGCVGGFATQLLEQPQLQEDRDVASALVCIRRQAHGMMGSVTDLLEFARVRESREPRMRPTSVAELLEEAVSDFSLPAHTERITLGDNYASCPRLFADRRLLRRVFCNLISNAIKHNGPDTQVWLDAQVAESRMEVLFSCCDDGAGVPPEVLPSIFIEFAGANDSSGDSTGLGLAFCKAAVEAHGGRIWCESLPQQGAQFYFTIPLRKELNNDQRVCGEKARVSC